VEYNLTIFKSIFDNKTHRQMTLKSFDEFESTMRALQTQVKRKPQKGERPNEETAELISPATYNTSDTRKNSNVLGWGSWVALDIDDYNGNIDDVFERFKSYRYFSYSSASSTKEKPKCRIVLPLTKFIPNEKIKHLWFAINKEFGEINDPQTKDLSRMYYVPANYPNSYTFFRSNKGVEIDAEILMTKHSFFQAYKESKWGATVESMLEDFKKDKLCNYDIKWSGYKDCPFVNKQLVTEYQVITETGWYHKMYQIMVSISAKALKRNYPITPKEVTSLCKEIDSETGGWYKNRPLELEASRAIEYAMKNI
tara:strand:- start:30508 stop:31440 length:933 start_codon:yes stop_codon:yes gene_type:complete